MGAVDDSAGVAAPLPARLYFGALDSPHRSARVLEPERVRSVEVTRRAHRAAECQEGLRRLVHAVAEARSLDATGFSEVGAAHLDKRAEEALDLIQRSKKLNR